MIASYRLIASLLPKSLFRHLSVLVQLPASVPSHPIPNCLYRLRSPIQHRVKESRQRQVALGAVAGLARCYQIPFAVIASQFNGSDMIKGAALAHTGEVGPTVDASEPVPEVDREALVPSDPLTAMPCSVRHSRSPLVLPKP
jgi:hypothetical protein